MHAILRRLLSENKKFVRFKHRDDHWSVQRKKIRGTDKAKEHFEDFYKQVFTTQWESIQEGLLGKPKYIAVVNNYGDTEETKTALENTGALNVRTLFNLEKQYVREKFEKKMRKRRLEKVWKMDEDMTKTTKTSTNENLQNNLLGTTSQINISENSTVQNNQLESNILQSSTSVSNTLENKFENTAFEYHSENTDLSEEIKKAELKIDELKTDELTADELRTDELRTDELKTDEPKRDYSLTSSLKDAKIDSTRLVDSKNILSTAILQEFLPATKIKGKEDWVSESTHYRYYENSEFPIRIEKEYDLHFPEHLNVYSYEHGNHSGFPQMKRGSTGVLNYYLMDGGSLFPVLALDLKPGHRVLDMCAAPGGKSMLAMQTLYPDQVVANDFSGSRVNKMFKVFNEYFYDLNERFIQTGKIKVTNRDGREIIEQDFDSVLVDVPCTTDRHSATENENNIFIPSRIKERLQLPVLQSELLFSAMESVKIGGVVVYSTCSLSPIQNDGVVHMALKRVWEETHMKFVVKDMSSALTQANVLYKFADQKLMKYGHLVLPSLPLNFGPTYFCKLKRIK